MSAAAAVECVEAACAEVRGAGRLGQVLRAVLATGNTLNAGTQPLWPRSSALHRRPRVLQDADSRGAAMASCKGKLAAMQVEWMSGGHSAGGRQ